MTCSRRFRRYRHQPRTSGDEYRSLTNEFPRLIDRGNSLTCSLPALLILLVTPGGGIAVIAIASVGRGCAVAISTAEGALLVTVAVVHVEYYPFLVHSTRVRCLSPMQLGRFASIQ